MLRFCFTILIALFASTPAAAQTRWFVVEDGEGRAIGHGSSAVRAHPQGREVRETLTYVVREGENPNQILSETSIRVEDAGGRVLTVSNVSGQGRTAARRSAAFEADHVRITRKLHGHETVRDIPLTPDIRLDGGDALVRSWDRTTPVTHRFRALALSAETVEQVELVLTPLAGGGGRLVRKGYDGADLRSVSIQTIDAGGAVLSTQRPMFGIVITIRPSTAPVARSAILPFSMDHDVLVKMPYRIPPEALKGHIRYRFTFKADVRFDPPATPEQRVTRDAGGVTLDICAACGPRGTLNEAERAAALSPTPWLQSEHPLLRSLASAARKSGASDADKMAMLARAGRKRLSGLDYAGHYSALEALRRRAGDCTEDAVVLAALGRAAGIPTKVASGLVYSRHRHHGLSNVFMPHSWTLALIDGQWRSFDMSLGGFDATHIALSVGDGDPRSIFAASQLASLIAMDSAAEVRKAPAR